MSLGHARPRAPGDVPIPSAAAAPNDRPEDVVDALEVTTLEEIDAAGLRKASLDVAPWSDDYWSLARGCLGRRYADPDFPDSDDWKEAHDHVLAHPASDIVASGDAHAIDLLSPAEKYDLLTGDTSGGLTAAMWKEGEGYYKADGKVEKWMGICHGWAQAASLVPRPRRKIRVVGADGLTFHLYPADIKALVSLLWAGAGPEVRFIGTRSTEKKPEKDEHGRLRDPATFDTNPATWHLAVVNQIGRARRSLIMDTAFDYEVWNQPIVGYDCAYFNPKTGKASSSLERATVLRADFPGDKLATYRSGAAVSLVGITMHVTYVKEVEPVQRATDGPGQDLHKTVDYSYDIEIGAGGEIVGGEWHHDEHPDFLWTPPPGAEAQTPAEHLATGSWRGDRSLPQAWREAAWSVARDRLPLAKLVGRLVALAGGA